MCALSNARLKEKNIDDEKMVRAACKARDDDDEDLIVVVVRLLLMMKMKMPVSLDLPSYSAGNRSGPSSEYQPVLKS